MGSLRNVRGLAWGLWGPVVNEGEGRGSDMTLAVFMLALLGF